MHSLDAHFNILLQRLEPDPDRAKKAKEQPGKLRDYLKKADTLSTVTPHTRLAGSYPRATAIRNIKDVDILVFVSRDYWGSIEELLAKLESTLRGYPKALDDVGEVKLRRQRRSVNVQLEGHDLSLDVVPALLPEEGSTTGILEIPDREWLRWVKSGPLGYSDLLSQLNQQHGGKAVPLTKMFKHWRTEKIKRAKVKSYWLESIVYDYLYHGWVSTERKGYAEIWADLFEAVYDRFLKVQEADEEQCPFIPDGCLGNHVAFNWQRSHFNTFMNRLKESKGWARAAVDAEEAEQSVQLWQNVFGPDWFLASKKWSRSGRRRKLTAQPPSRGCSTWPVRATCFPSHGRESALFLHRLRASSEGLGEAPRAHASGKPAGEQAGELDAHAAQVPRSGGSVSAGYGDLARPTAAARRGHPLPGSHPLAGRR